MRLERRGACPLASPTTNSFSRVLVAETTTPSVGLPANELNAVDCSIMQAVSLLSQYNSVVGLSPQFIVGLVTVCCEAQCSVQPYHNELPAKKPAPRRPAPRSPAYPANTVNAEHAVVGCCGLTMLRAQDGSLTDREGAAPRCSGAGQCIEWTRDVEC